MASKYTHDVVATTGEYKNAAGETKKNYTNVGKAFTDDQGRISLKMVSIPVGPDWSGWLSLYPAKEREERQPLGARSPEYGKQELPPGRQQQRSMPSAGQAPADNHDDDDISF